MKNIKPIWDLSKETDWDMSKERQFIETLLTQRFNFFVVFYALVLNGGIQCGNVGRAALYSWGFVIGLLLTLTIARSQIKLDMILGRSCLFHEHSQHPAFIIDEAVKAEKNRRHKLWSMRRLIGYWIPGACTLSLLFLAGISWYRWSQNPI